MSEPVRPPAIYIDADACPVKDEVYKVARRYAMRVVVVANASLWVPSDTHFELVVKTGFGVVDDYVAETVGRGDIVVTADIPLAARCVAKQAAVLNPKGRLLTDANIGEAVGVRDLIDELRQSGLASGGPAPMTPKDRSRFLAMLDQLVNAVRRGKLPKSL
jgi:uncharacterized protein YaiI (UPF0178 family)